MQRRIPRIVKLFDAYCQTLKGASDLPYEERQRLKAERLSAVMLESDRIKARRLVRTGFTLVEMLVAVGLVVLMMFLFAQIFAMCTGAMATQKGISENDQRVRMVATVLRGDLKNRTMIEVSPFASTEAGADPLNRWDKRIGYFYISENDPDDNTDDVLQFTTQVGSEDDPYTGAARVLLPDGAGNYGPGSPAVTVPPGGNPPPLPPQGTYWQNQPEFDDQLVGIPNYTASSRHAEVSYFLRNGTLYRRVMLIREPSISASGGLGDSPTPTSWTPPANVGTSLSFGIYQVPTTAANARNFYTDFDFSAAGPSAPNLEFIGARDLSPINAALTTSLLSPENRFGHGRIRTPREHVNQFVDATGATQPGYRFIGRFTHEETSFISPGSTSPYDLFGYPGLVLGPGTRVPNPYQFDWVVPTNPLNTALTYDPTTGKVREYAGGNRIGEDVLLHNVKRFDIKVYDETAASTGLAGGWGPDGAPGVIGVDDDLNGTLDDVSEAGWEGSDDGAFADLGHTGNGIYSNANLLNNTYCPPIPPNPPVAALTKPNARFYRYDTWSPSPVITDPAPFRPLRGTARMPLRAIQIKVTFLDPTSNQLRDITIVQSLVEVLTP